LRAWRTDSQQLRALVRQARKDAQPEKRGAAPRHGRAYREIFQLVHSELSGENQGETAATAALADTAPPTNPGLDA